MKEYINRTYDFGALAVILDSELGKQELLERQKENADTNEAQTSMLSLRLAEKKIGKSQLFVPS